MKRLLTLLSLTVLWMMILGGKAHTQSAALTVAPPTVTTTVTEPDYPLTHSDLYCAGFISSPTKVNQFVAGGWNTPYQTRFSRGDFIFLQGGDYQPGTRVSVIRQLQDVNRLFPIADAQKLESQSGQIYADIGYAVVTQRRGELAIAQVEFACDNIVTGDQLVPFHARELPSYRKTSTLERFPAAPSPVHGRIVAARDYDQYLSAGRKVYLDVGAQKGLHPGDYLQIVRGYQQRELDVADQAMQYAPSSDDSQKIAPQLSRQKLGQLPRRLVGELVVLSTQPTTATGMITFVLEEVHVGDTVEMESKPLHAREW